MTLYRAGAAFIVFKARRYVSSLSSAFARLCVFAHACARELEARRSSGERETEGERSHSQHAAWSSLKVSLGGLQSWTPSVAPCPPSSILNSLIRLRFS